LALAALEAGGHVGVDLDDGRWCDADIFDRLGRGCVGPPPPSDETTRSGNKENDAVVAVARAASRRRRISVITQNVDTLHSKGGVKHCLHLHGRGDLIRCMNCGYTCDRMDYHDELTNSNRDWLDELAAFTSASGGADDGAAGDDGRRAVEPRPDGDAELVDRVGAPSYDDFVLPPCTRCGGNVAASSDENFQQGQRSFFKTDVVFFGDSVPKHRFDISYAAIDASDGILCIGTSLSVHSAYRLVKRGIERGIPVAILNVGETRVEKEGLGLGEGGGLVTKFESPIGETLSGLVEILDREKKS
jgi:NAD-dependent deacetylase sirtuin 4